MCTRCVCLICTLFYTSHLPGWARTFLFFSVRDAESEKTIVKSSSCVSSVSLACNHGTCVPLGNKNSVQTNLGCAGGRMVEIRNNCLVFSVKPTTTATTITGALLMSCIFSFVSQRCRLLRLFCAGRMLASTALAVPSVHPRARREGDQDARRGYGRRNARGGRSIRAQQTP